jgi:hypothetical protein
MSEFTIQNGVLLKYTGQGGHVHVPEGVVKLGEFVFYDLHNIDSVYLPEGLIEIGSDAFNVASVRFVQVPQSLQIIRDGAFKLCRQLSSVVPARMAYSKESEGCLFLSDCKNLTIMEESAFNGCGRIRKVRLPESLLEISRGAFFDCRNLEIVTLGNATQRIAEVSFSCCTNLKCMYIPKSVISINQEAFYRIREGEQGKEIYVAADIVEKLNLQDRLLDDENTEFPSGGMVRIDTSHPKPKNLTIWGTPGSFAQEYAESFEIPFYSEEILNRIKLDLYIRDTYRQYVEEHKVGDLKWLEDMLKQAEDKFRELHEEYRLLFSSAARGDANAQYELAKFHRNYNWSADCAGEYLKCMMVAAQSGHIEAMLECARVLIRKEIYFSKERRIKLGYSNDINKAAAGYLNMILAGGNVQAPSDEMDFSNDTVKEAAFELAALYADKDSGLYDRKEADKLYEKLADYQ